MTVWGFILQFVLLIIGFALLVKGADWFVDGAAEIATKLGIPQLVIGLTIVAMGTSAPEAATSITAAVNDSAGLAIGNVLGSNIMNVLLILGLCAIVTPLAIEKSTLWIEIPFVTVISALMLGLGLWGNVLGRVDGLVFILLFIAFLVYLFIMTRKQKSSTLIEKEAENKEKPRKLWFVIFLLIIGVAMIVLGSHLAVSASKKLAVGFGMSEEFIGLTIVAFGTSLPELVTSLVAAKKHQADLAVGNIVGSNIFNILFVLGITTLIRPLSYTGFLFDNIIAIATMILLFLCIIFTKDKKLKRIGGVIMTISYISYFTYTLISSLPE